MKLKVFTLEAIREYADFLIEINESEGQEEDFITEMLSVKMTRIEALNSFKEAIMVYHLYIKTCLIHEDYETAGKFNQVIKIEYENTISLLDAIGDLYDGDEHILNTMLAEINYINTTNI